MATARLAAWLKRAGDAVKRGEDLVELETDKAVLMLECPADGVLLEIVVEAGVEVSTGELLAYVGRPGEAVRPAQSAGASAPAAPPLSAALPAAPPVPVIATMAPEPAAGTPALRRRISPAARRMARTLNLDLTRIEPARPGGRLTTLDLQRFLAGGPAPASRLPAQRVPLTSTQRTMAGRMLESAREIPQFSVTLHADAAALLAAKARLQAEGHRCSLTVLLVQLTARTLLRHPLLNARFDSDALFLFETVNLGVAVDAPNGLVVPVLHGAERLGVLDLAQSLADLAASARSGRLALAQISDATFTLSNLGMLGVSQFTPLVNPPQAAILGIGAVEPAVIPTVTPTGGGTRHVQRMALTVSADHRVADGAAAARFLGDLRQAIETATLEL